MYCMIKKISSTGENFEHRHYADVVRIKQVLLKNGYDADLPSCANIWDEYSDSYAAGWLGLPKDDDELWQAIQWRVEKMAI